MIRTGILFTLALALASCGVHRIDLAESNIVKLEQVGSEGLDIDTSIFENDGDLVISGRMKRGPLDQRPIPGHIDIAIVAPSGEVLASIQVNLEKLRGRRHGSDLILFRTEISGVPPQNSVVRVNYHPDRH